MPHTRDEITEHLAARWCWQVARRDEARVARRLDRKHVVDGVYRLDAGAVLEDFFHCLQAFGVMAWLEQLRGAAMDRVLRPVVQDVLRYGVKTLVGLERSHALPALLWSDEARMRLVGCNAQQVRQGVCQRGRTKRQGERTPGPMCPDTLAHNMVQCHVRDLEALCNRVIRGLATAGVVGQRVTLQGRWHRSGDDRRRSGLWPGDPHEAPRGQAGPGARDRGHGLRLASAPPDRCRDEDA